MSKDMEDLAARGEATLQHYGVKGMKWGVTRANLASGAKTVAKTTGKVAARAGAVAALGAVGVQAVVATASVGAFAAANPEVISAGKDYAKLALRELGVIEMGVLDTAKAGFNVRRTFGTTTTVR